MPVPSFCGRNVSRVRPNVRAPVTRSVALHDSEKKIARIEQKLLPLMGLTRTS